MWWYDSSINNIRSKTSILAVRKPENPETQKTQGFPSRRIISQFCWVLWFQNRRNRGFWSDIIDWWVIPSYCAGFFVKKTMILQVFFAVLEYVTDTLATPLTQPTRRWFRPWWLGNVKSMMHPVYQKWWYCWCLFCVVMSFRFLWLCWYHREKISWFSFGNENVM